MGVNIEAVPFVGAFLMGVIVGMGIEVVRREGAALKGGGNEK